MTAAARKAAGAVVPVVLAAGASSRMGTPKFSLDFDGRPALDLVLAACRGAGLARAIVVMAPARDARIAAGDAAVVVNPHPERGMLSSLQAGLARLPPEAAAFIVFPVDHALVEASDVTAVVSAWQRAAAATPAAIFIPVCAGRRGHPILVDARLAPEFLGLGPDATARDAVGADPSRVALVETASDRVLLDLDTPEDYARCLDRRRRRE